MIEQLDHVGIVVDDLEASIAMYQEKFNMQDPYREVLEDQHVEVVLFDVGPNHVELLRPLHPDTSCGRFLEKRGPGVHHIAYAVKDIRASLAELIASGMNVLDPEPRPGVRNSQVAFIHPRSVGGVLTEIIQQRHPSGMTP
jgi:methylmalonyl-CoA/ethylmalonyl-CoA epimerase